MTNISKPHNQNYINKSLTRNEWLNATCAEP